MGTVIKVTRDMDRNRDKPEKKYYDTEFSIFQVVEEIARKHIPRTLDRHSRKSSKSHIVVAQKTKSCDRL